jgi:hypothetical protein
LKKNWKFKHSASMHNLKSNMATDESSFDNYHTIHGGFGNIEMFAFDDNLNSRTDSTEVAYKCCCGRKLCEAVVPIQQYLETYFVNKTVRVKHTGGSKIGAGRFLCSVWRALLPSSF